MTLSQTASSHDSRAAPFAHNDIHLIHATTPKLMARTWTNNRLEWGKAFDEQTYHARERVLASQDFTNNNKLKVWILVPKTFDPDHPDLDLILSAVESFERPGMVATKTQGLKEVLSVSVASVFTPAHYRGNGYASLMMKLLHKEIEKMDGVQFTFLYSDVGPTFYGRLGWTARRSDEIVVPTSHIVTSSSSTGAGEGAETLKTVTDQDLAELMETDARLLREFLQAQLDASTNDNSDRVLVAATPEPSCIAWLHARSRFTAQHLLKLDQYEITALGARDTQSDSFVLWFHDFIHHQLYTVRWRLDPKAKDSEETARELIRAAQAEAQKWKMPRVVLWNPEQSLADLLGLEMTYREDAIPSLGLINNSSILDNEKVDWVLSEKYAWC